jgi:putative endonuclease
MASGDATGRRAERLARWLLQAKGYAILGSRVRVATGEIDLIARRGDLVAFVEVKARARPEEALAALGPRQRRRIERTAEAFLAGRPDLAQHRLRFDLVTWRPWRLPRHLPDAWRP